MLIAYSQLILSNLPVGQRLLNLSYKIMFHIKLPNKGTHYFSQHGEGSSV